MSESELTKYQQHAQTITAQVSDFLLSHFGSRITQHEKEPGHFSIPQDQQANDMYETYLRKHTPEVALYTEEGERNLDSDLVWLIDPIEGTSNYCVGLDYWATQIALMHHHQIVLSIIADSTRHTTYHAIKGQGAFQDDTRLHISQTGQLNQALISTEKGSTAFRHKVAHFFTQALPHVKTIRTPGATGLDLAHTAAGRFDAYVGLGSNLYDYAPGILLIQEAGGDIITPQGQPWHRTDTDFIAGNPNLISQLSPFTQ